jgi:hypothetical protein
MQRANSNSCCEALPDEPEETGGGFGRVVVVGREEFGGTDEDCCGVEVVELEPTSATPVGGWSARAR